MGGKSANNCVQATLVCAFLYHGATFHWMVGEVQVIEAFKGTQKGQTVQVANTSAPCNKELLRALLPPAE